jgi:hypothetical protein
MAGNDQVVERDWRKVRAAIGFINCGSGDEPEVELLLSNSDPSYGGMVGIETAEHCNCCENVRTRLTVLNMGYYKAACPDCWELRVSEQLAGNEKELKQFKDGLYSPQNIDASRSLKCDCEAPATVCFDEGNAHTCAWCAGAVIGAAQEDEESVREHIGTEHG